MSRMKLWWFVGFLAIVLRANAVFSLPQVAVIGPQAGSEECRRAQASWHESFGCVCEEYPTVDSALAADRRPRMYVFWKGDSTPTPADGEKFRAAVVRVRQTDASANVTLIARDAAWRKAAEGLSVTVIDAEEMRLVTTYLREAYERGWGVDWSVVKDREKRMARRTQRLHDAKWGVFNHFLGHECKTAAEWNAKVAGFDVKRVADQLEACGAGFYFLTVMQGDRWMCAPSATYDSIAGTKPGEACSVRDLPLELADELGKRGIDLYLYFTGDGPYKDPGIGPRFGLTTARHLGVTESFVDKWSSVLGELSKRYGNKVKGWWIDGCYDDMLGYTDKLLARYGAAVRAGNPAALVAMNNGVFPYFKRHWADEDFTAGEFNDFYCVPEKRFVEGAQTFVLAPLGAWRGDYCAWSSPGCKRSAEYVANYVRLVNANGGVVCIDVKVHEDGSWDSDQMEVLKAVGRATGTLEDRASPAKIIFDTDMYTDFDDAGALACLHALADAGECEILATVANTRDCLSVAMCEIINAYYGRPDIPVGCVRGIGVGREEWATHEKRFGAAVRKYAKWVKHENSSDAPDAAEVYRKVLTAQPDKSVVICSVGFLSNMRKLMETDRDLVARKVKLWVAMACSYPKGKECNSMTDWESSKIAFENWPTPIVFSDFQYGMDCFAGRAIAESGVKDSPVADVFRGNMPPRDEIAKDAGGHLRCCNGLCGRAAWDETAVLAAVRGVDSYFNVHRGAYCMVGTEGEDEWVPDEKGGRHMRLTEKTSKVEIGKIIDELICRGPRQK